MTGRNLSPHSHGSWAGQHEAAVTASRFSHGSSAACQEEILVPPMAAGVTPTVNVGQQVADTKEYTRSSNKLKTKGFVGSKCPSGRHRKPAGAAFVLYSCMIQKLKEHFSAELL